MHRLLIIVLVAVSGMNAFAATRDLSEDRILQTVHPDEATKLQPNYGLRADPAQLKAFEASVQRPFIANQYHLRFLKYFVENPLVAFVIIFLLVLSLPLVISFRQHP